MSDNDQFAASWHPAGRILAFEERKVGVAQSADEFLTMSFGGDENTGWTPNAPASLLKLSTRGGVPTFSPDGNWIAYSSRETGVSQIYVRPFPGPGGQWLVSVGQGEGQAWNPSWSRMEKTLFYTVNSPPQIMALSYTVSGDAFRAGKPELWSKGRWRGRPRAPSWDVALHPDGKRFALAAAPDAEMAARRNNVVVVFNFFDELRRIAPAVR